ncbi:hypothetical protein V2G26_001223 [Clonostachys chloroleuca]
MGNDYFPRLDFLCISLINVLGQDIRAAGLPDSANFLRETASNIPHQSIETRDNAAEPPHLRRAALFLAPVD